MRLALDISMVTVTFMTALIIGPVVVGINGPLAYGSVLAATGGNSNGHSQGANGNSNNQGSHAGSNATASTNPAANAEVETALNLGALNAAHASARAFAHASSNSRIGKIRTYYLANQDAIIQQTALMTALAALKPATPVTLDQFKVVEAAYLALQENADMTLLASLQASYTQALIGAGITDGQVVALQPAYDTWQAAETLAIDTLNTAASKTPVTDETRAALDALLVNKIN